MTLREQLLQQALMLPTADQAFLAQSLEDNLISQTPPEIGESAGLAGVEFLAELRRRSAAYRAGQSAARPVGEVMDALHERQADARTK